MIGEEGAKSSGPQPGRQGQFRPIFGSLVLNLRRLADRKMKKSLVRRRYDLADQALQP